MHVLKYICTLIIYTILFQRLENDVDPDQMLQNAASDLGLHSLQLIQQYFIPINKL